MNSGVCFSIFADYGEESNFPLSKQLLQNYDEKKHLSFTCRNDISRIACYLAWLAIWEFQETYSRSPMLHSIEDAKECSLMAIKKCEEIFARPNQRRTKEKVIKIAEDFAFKLALYFGTELPPIACSSGGFIGNEVLKSIVRKENNILLNQWCHAEFFNLVSKQVPEKSNAGPEARNMYHIALFGEEKTRIIENQKIFIVGCGALGCEYLGVFAKMGVGLGKDGLISFTDMDKISSSNLSRQFLFTEDDVEKGNFKSEACKRQLQCFNNKLNLECQTESISLSTRYPWGSMGLIVAAVDNMKARNDLGELCRLYDISYLESGTEGQGSSYRVILKNTCQPYQVTIQNVSEKGILQIAL